VNAIVTLPLLKSQAGINEYNTCKFLKKVVIIFYRKFAGVYFYN